MPQFSNYIVTNHQVLWDGNFTLRAGQSKTMRIDNDNIVTGSTGKHRSALTFNVHPRDTGRFQVFIGGPTHKILDKGFHEGQIRGHTETFNLGGIISDNPAGGSVDFVDCEFKVLDGEYIFSDLIVWYKSAIAVPNL